MKHIYLIIALILLSCAESTQKKETNSTKAEEVVEIASEEENASNSKPENSSLSTSFEEEFEKLPLKNIPMVDSTSFESFIDEDDIKAVNIKAFSLPQIYQNWYMEGYNYKAISGYKLDLSPSFLAAVITVRKGDHELENQLITFDLKGNYIDSQVVAYDEIAEGASRIQSQIKQDQLIIDHIFWMDEKEVTTEKVKINENGSLQLSGKTKTVPVLKERTLIDTVVQQLGLHGSNIIIETSKVFSNSPEKAVVVLGEMAHKDEDNEGVYELNSHITIVSRESGKISHKFFESSKTNGWVSDAIFIEDIVIDSLNYPISETKSAFGVIVRYRTLSQPNPYNEEVLSLYTTEKESLRKILDHYTIYESSGEVNVNIGACNAEFLIEKNELSIANSKTSGFFDIQINTTHTKRFTAEDENGECQTEETITDQTSRLKYNGNSYQEIK